jgi:molybdopterin synthase catalytic subunit
MARVAVQEADFDIGAEFAALTAGRTDIGGIGCFVGTVRAAASGPELTALTLEQYPGMTLKALRNIAAEAERRWHLLGCTVIHRHGTMRLGENIVLVLAASAHRHEALDATSFLIDWLKTRAPFWKKEHFADGSADWVAARATDDTAAARWDACPPGAGA